MNLNEQQRLAYLDALGVDVWVPRDQADAAADSPECMDWETLQAGVASCTGCGLHSSRTQTVFGVGNASANLMVIGEAPGAEEDRVGEPFVGRAGKLLDEMLRAIREDRTTVFIANVLKCRPPGNRDPSADESAACRAWLRRQIELVQPQLLLVVGRIAAQQLLQTDVPVGKLRGKRHDFEGIPLVVTYHPAYLLRSPAQKARSWDDLCLARKVMQEQAA